MIDYTAVIKEDADWDFLRAVHDFVAACKTAYGRQQMRLDLLCEAYNHSCYHRYPTTHEDQVALLLELAPRRRWYLMSTNEVENRALVASAWSSVAAEVVAMVGVLPDHYPVVELKKAMELQRYLLKHIYRPEVQEKFEDVCHYAPGPPPVRADTGRHKQAWFKSVMSGLLGNTYLAAFLAFGPDCHNRGMALP